MPTKPAPDLSITGTYSKMEVAAMLRVGYDAVDAMIRRGDLVAKTCLNSQRVLGSSIARFLEIPVTNLPESTHQVVTPRTDAQIRADRRRLGYV